MKMTQFLRTACRSAVLIGLCSLSVAAQATDKAAPPNAAKPEKLKRYTLHTCPVSDEKLGSMGDAYVHRYKQREIKFCCKSCLSDFNQDPAKYILKIEQAEAKAAGLKPYPLTSCIVSDEKLGEMGEPYVHKYKGQEIKFCCKSCLSEFNEDPARFLKKIEAARLKP